MPRKSPGQRLAGAWLKFQAAGRLPWRQKKQRSFAERETHFTQWDLALAADVSTGSAGTFFSLVSENDELVQALFDGTISIAQAVKNRKGQQNNATENR